MLVTVVLVAVVIMLLGVISYLAVSREPAAPAAAKLDSPQAVAARLRELGAPCENLSPISDPAQATARAHCWVSGREIMIGTYASHEAVEEQWRFYRDLLAGVSPDSAMALGDVWTISGDDSAYIKRAAQLLGGEYREI